MSMYKEQREQQMMTSAEAYAAEIYKDEPDNFHTDEQLCETINDFCAGWRAADFHPRWYDAQGDIVPEYGREVIVIGRNGKIFYGHRPDPKEVTMIDGKPYYAKTYGKNGWNWDNIALWLDVEVPYEMVDKIVSEYFKENKQPLRKKE